MTECASTATPAASSAAPATCSASGAPEPSQPLVIQYGTRPPITPGCATANTRLPIAAPRLVMIRPVQACGNSFSVVDLQRLADAGARPVQARLHRGGAEPQRTCDL